MKNNTVIVSTKIYNSIISIKFFVLSLMDDKTKLSKIYQKFIVNVKLFTLSLNKYILFFLI